MKVGTDAMLLGSWAPPPASSSPSSSAGPGPHTDGARPPARILDVGTGTGVLALMMAQKTQPQATSTASHTVREACGGPRIVAIDVDAGAAAQAAENAALSPWRHRIWVLHASLQQLVLRARELRCPQQAPAQPSPAGAAAPAQPPPVAAMPPTQPPPVAEVADDAVGALSASAAAPSAPAEAEARAAGSEAALGATGALLSAATTDEAVAPAPVAAARAAGSGGSGCAHAGVTADDVGPFDLIISNPPYFVDSSKPVQGRAARASARHADVSLPFADLASGCAELLAPGGSVCVVLPPPEAARFGAEAAAAGLVPVELVRVFTAAEDEQERRHLMRLQRAADLPRGTALESLPATSVLVVNGPITREAPQQQQPQQPQLPTATSAHSDSAVGNAAAAAAAGPSPAPRPARFFTPEYLALTSEFHHPAFLTAASAVAAAASGAGAAPGGGRSRANPAAAVVESSR